MPAQRLVWVLLAIWVAAYAASFWSLFFAVPTGDGFTRGLNRVSGFLGWQALAGLAAIGLWAVGLSHPKRQPGRWLYRVPILLAALLILFLVGVVLFAQFRKPSPDASTPMPVTQPVTLPATDS